MPGRANRWCNQIHRIIFSFYICAIELLASSYVLEHYTQKNWIYCQKVDKNHVINCSSVIYLPRGIRTKIARRDVSRDITERTHLTGGWPQGDFLQDVHMPLLLVRFLLRFKTRIPNASMILRLFSFSSASPLLSWSFSSSASVCLALPRSLAASVPLLLIPRIRYNL